MYAHPVSIQCSQRVFERRAFSAGAETFDGCPGIKIFESQVPGRPLVGMSVSVLRWWGDIPIIRYITRTDRELTGLICSVPFAVSNYTEVVHVPKRCAPPSTLLPLSRAPRQLTLIPSSRLLPRPSLRRALQRGFQSCRNSPRDTRTRRWGPHSSTSESPLSRVSSRLSDRRP